MSNSWHISRRSFLKGIGASLALPYLEIMGSSSAASHPKPPTRLACIFQPNGVFPKAWDVTGVGKQYKLSSILSPLQNLKRELTILSNLDNVGKGHVQMTGAFLTGKTIEGDKNAVSLDQMVAQAVGKETPFPSIVLGTEPPRQGNAGRNPISFANTVSWSSDTTRISPEINPRVAFDRMFRDNSSPEAKRKAAQRKSVVDLVLDDAKSLQRKASIQDQHKIGEYLDSVRSVEVQIENTLNPQERTWKPITKPDYLRPGAGIPQDRDRHLKLMVDLMVLSFWTDTTRVGTLMTAHGFSRQNFSFLDGVTSDHHGMSHHKFQDQAVDEYTRVSRWYIQQLAYMLEKMDGIDEGNGSLLDNSTILYGSSMKDGNGHKKGNLPIILAGRGGGKFQPQGHVVCDEHTPLANLHLTILQKFGVENDHFNNASTGTIAQLV
ncbi:MAG: hypothetical protein CMI18_05415 [Opitutaceae bacterium]|nr:hypothetical protein [Opitutaceae bacterium]